MKLIRIAIVIVAKLARIAIAQDVIATILYLEAARSTTCVPKLLEQERQRRSWGWSSAIRARIDVLDEADGNAEVITIAELLCIDAIAELANDPCQALDGARQHIELLQETTSECEQQKLKLSCPAASELSASYTERRCAESWPSESQSDGAQNLIHLEITKQIFITSV